LGVDEKFVHLREQMFQFESELSLGLNIRIELILGLKGVGLTDKSQCDGEGGGLPGFIRFLILLVPEPISRASLVDALIHLSCTGCTWCTYSCKYSCTQELMYLCAHVLRCS
jgi:hypothetical protein